jgi:transposase
MHEGRRSQLHLVSMSKATRAGREHWLRPEGLGTYASVLNDIEREWKTLKAHHLGHKTFRNADSLKVTIDTEIQTMNANRKPIPVANQRISA